MEKESTMNRVYRVIWSKVKRCYVVVSELTRSCTKDNRSHGSYRRNAFALCVVLLCGSMSVAGAADTTVGTGSGVAYGTSSNAPKAENVAIGKGSSISYSNGASAATGDIVVGNGANINNYASQGGSIAIGKNAKIENMAGGAEATFALGQTTFSGSLFSSARIPADPTKVVGSIAIGDNTFARTGSTMIGSHNYSGDLGDTTVDSAATRTSNLNVYATTVGANSFSNGAFTTTTGVYNIISGEYNGGRSANGQKNFGATITGALNSIESMDSAGSGYYSGIANSIVGTANRTQNSNGSLIFGAGNEITNSYTSISGLPGGLFSTTPTSAKDLANILREATSESDGGGSTMAIGGGNKADYTQKTQITGVNNKVTGTAGNIAKLNSVSGFKNTVTNASNNIIMGNDHTVTANNTIAIGGLSSADTRSAANTTSIGYDAKVSKEGGVALGYKSNATVDKGAAGYDPATGAASTETNSTWKATSAAVSVGDVGNGITRQITSVAAGTADTDAVNVAQLKKAVAGASDGNDTLVTNANGLSLSGNTLSMNVTDTAGNAVTGSVDLSAIAGSADTRNTVTAGENVNIDETTNTDGSSTYTINVKADGQVANGNTGIVTGGTVYHETRVTNDGSYVKADNTAAQNLTILDSQVKNNADNISNLDTRVTHIGNSLTKLGDRVDRVGAGAAALAALHPQDFDPDDKWDFAAGYGNYKDAHAVAVGAFYRPNEDTLFSVGGTVGNGNNMVNAGVSFKFGQSNGVSTSRLAMAKEIKDLRHELEAMKSAMLDANAGRKIDTSKLQLFPDVPQNHWAYEYVATLAGNGMIQGYPDGTFDGNRPMTRYEFAAMLYRAMLNGATLSDKILTEFAPELERFTVDTVRTDKDGKPTIERVRVAKRK